MKIFNGKYGWSTSAHNTDKKTNEETKYYIPVQFKKGYEPSQDEVSGKLIFKYDTGEERECFFSSYKKQDGTITPKLVIYGKDDPKEPVQSFYRKDVQTNLTGTQYDVSGYRDSAYDVNDDDLPF